MCRDREKRIFQTSHLIFEKNKKNQTFYKTPYGQMLIESEIRDTASG